jgi:peroxiredoxin
VQLQEHLQDYRNAGLGVVALTYDAQPSQQQFVEKFGIEYPMLSDVDAASVRALDILNQEYAPGDSAYGIPYPGVFVLDSDLTVRGKIFIEGYETRVDAEHTLAAAREALDLGPPAVEVN